jgi:ATP synthase protein I
MPPSLEELDARLKRAKGEAEVRDGADTGRGDLPGSAMGMAARIGIELVAGVAVGTGAGYLLDQWLGTTPWLLIVFFFLGAAAGTMNVYRAAMGEGLSVGFKKPPPGQDPSDGNPGGGQ